ncbi:hypothetical protein IWQ60_011343, partial [Tieghemiomyces parasiticus]
MSVNSPPAVYQDVFSTLSHQGFKNITRRLSKLPKSHRNMASIIEAFSMEENDYLNLHFLKFKSDSGKPSGRALVEETNSLRARALSELAPLRHLTSDHPPRDAISVDSAPLLCEILTFIVEIANIRVIAISILIELCVKHNNSYIEASVETLERSIDKIEPFCKNPVLGKYAEVILCEQRLLFHLLQLNERIRRYDYFSSAFFMYQCKSDINHWRKLTQPQPTDNAKPEETAETSTWTTLWNSLSESIYPGRTNYSSPPLLQWAAFFFKALCTKLTIYFEKQIRDREAQLPQGKLKQYWNQLNTEFLNNIHHFVKRPFVRNIAIYHYNNNHDPDDIHNFGFQIKHGGEDAPKTDTLTTIYCLPSNSKYSSSGFIIESLKFIHIQLDTLEVEPKSLYDVANDQS